MKSLSSTALAVAVLLMAAFGVSADQLTTKKSLNLAVARQVVELVEKEAAKINFNVVIAVADEGGHIICLERMDDVQFASVEIAEQKAYAAAAFKRPTKFFHDSLAAGNTSLLKLPGLIMTEGGVPLIVDGKVIGGLGVSGGAPAKDHVIAQAAADALAKIVSQ